MFVRLRRAGGSRTRVAMLGWWWFMTRRPWSWGVVWWRWFMMRRPWSWGVVWWRRFMMRRPWSWGVVWWLVVGIGWRWVVHLLL